MSDVKFPHCQPLTMPPANKPARAWSEKTIEDHVAAAQPDLMFGDDGIDIIDEEALGEPDCSWAPDSPPDRPEAFGHDWEWSECADVIAPRGAGHFMASIIGVSSDLSDPESMHMVFGCWVCQTCRLVFDSRKPIDTCDIVVTTGVLNL